MNEEEFIETTLGEIPARIYFSGKFPTEDTELAEEFELELKFVRKALYELNENGLVELGVTVDKEGWHTYTWTKAKDGLERFRVKKIKEEIDIIEEKLRGEKGLIFYVCPFGERYIFEDAFSLRFECPSCKKQLVFCDNTSKVELLEKELAALEEKLDEFL